MDHARQSRFSDPGRFADLLDTLPVHPAGLSAVARNVIVHYRASGHVLPDATRDDINLRWVHRQLEMDHQRHAAPLDAPREVTRRLQGCCRDHTVFCVSALRARGIPARSRVGFAGYFTDGWHHDHVIVEAWIDGRWSLFDPELAEATGHIQDPTDMIWDAATGRGFVSAANAWGAYRRDEIDADTFGVDPDIPALRGARFLFDEVIIEIAHRFGDELLLWDRWGRMGEPGGPVDERDARWADDIAALLTSADQEDTAAEHEALRRYLSDQGLHPGGVVTQASPLNEQLNRVTI